MATETEEKVEEKQPEVIEFPREINGITFQNADELKRYADEMMANIKDVKSILKTAGKVGRPPSIKKVQAEAVSKVLNDSMTDELADILDKCTEDTAIRVIYDKESGMFKVPVQKSGGGGGSSPKGGKVMLVDGTEYPSAKNARETLYPDTKGNIQNRQSIISFLKTKGHEVEE